MVKVVEYGTYIIDISDAMIEHRKGLNAEQIQILNQVRERAQCLVTKCLQNEHSDLTTLYYFLSGQAPIPVTHIINHCNFILRMWKLHLAYQDGIEKILACIIAVREELQQMKLDLINFMEKIGMEIPDRRYIHKPDPKVSNRATEAENLMNDPRMTAPSPIKEKKPIRRISPRKIIKKS